MTPTGNRHERDFQPKAIKLIEAKGGYVLNTVVSAYQAQGEPDLTCCINGKYVVFELKVDDNEPTALQKYKMEKVRRAGGLVFVPYTLKEIEDIVNDIQDICKDDGAQE